MENPWNYPVLPTDRSISILRLEGGSKDDELVASVWVVSLDDPNRATYEAVSYVWGNPVPADTMIFNGIPGKEISPALATALRAFRLPDLALLLWVDALCINQQNIDERGQQVSLMADIYCSAKATVIWLGDAHEHTSDAIEILHRAAKYLEDNLVSNFETFSPERNSERGFPEPHEMRWTGLVHLFSRPWFERVWILQEFGLSSNPAFVIGKQHISKATFFNGIMWLFYSGYSTGIPKMRVPIAQAFQVMRCAPKNTSMRWPLLRLLGDARTFQATDPRDKVFGVLGLSEEGSKTPICSLLRPDYNKTLAQVLSDLTRHFLECEPGDPSQDRRLNIFQYVNHTERYVFDSEFPSWVPRWDERETVVDLGFEGHRASGMSHAQFRTPFSRSEIVLRGFKLGTVTSIPKYRTKGSPSISTAKGQWLRLKKLWKDLVTNLDGTQDLGQFALVFAQTVSMSGCIEQIPDRPNADEFVAYCLENLREEGSIPSDVRGERVSDSPAGEHLPEFDFKDFPLPVNTNSGDAQLMRTCVTQHTLFTMGTRVVTGPDSVSVGDVLVILYGGDVPFVLRPEKDYYTLVGECYLFGSMNGEALQEKKERGIEDNWFLLR